MLVAAVDVARELGAGKRVVTVIPDSAERYLSKGLFD
jgi:cysteine synthase